MGLLERIFVVVNLVLAVGICVAIGSSLETVTTYKTDADKYRNLYGSSQKEAESLRADAQEVTKRATEQQVEINKLTVTLSSEQKNAKDKIDSLQKEIDELNGKLADGERVRNDAVTDAAVMRDRVKELEKQNLDKAGQIGKLEAELTAKKVKYEAEFKDLEEKDNATIARLNEDIKRLEALLDVGKRGMPEIFGKVTGDPMTSAYTGDYILTITTDKGSQAARVGYKFDIYRESEGIYLGNGVVESVVGDLGEGSQLLTVIIKNPDLTRPIKKGDNAATKIPGAAK